MAIQTQYRLYLDGWALGTDGDISRDQTQVAVFDTLELAEQFLEASGSAGNYTVTVSIEKIVE